MRNRPVYRITLRLSDRSAARSGPRSLRRYTGVLRRHIAETGHSRGSRENRGGGEEVDFSILDKAVEDSRWTDIKEISEAPNGAEPEVEYVTSVGAGEVVLDFRSPDEAEEHPLRLEGSEVNELPFYKIATEFGNLDQTKTYLLYCRNGVMSRLQALILKERGVKNVKVIRI